jgi:SAM-dependent methyltransferase
MINGSETALPSARDPIGTATMSPAMREADRYARYLYDSVKAWLKPPILEVGAGYGTYTSYLTGHGFVIATDIDDNFLAALDSTFAQQEVLVRHLDLNDPDEIATFAELVPRSVFCCNVIEHIADDIGMLRALHQATTEGGHLCLIAPAHPGLYGYLDEQAGHYRRYSRTTLAQTMTDAGWQVVTTFHVNALGALGWWCNHRFLSRRSLDHPRINNQLWLYDRCLVPLARWTDCLFSSFLGLSVIGIGRKSEPEALATES